MLKPYNYSLSGQLQNSLLTSPVQAQLSFTHTANSQSFVNTYNTGISRLLRLTDKAKILTQKRLSADPSYTLGRGIGVKLAWEYEKLDFQLGGRGSEKWMQPHKDELISKGRISGAEGHHAQNVADHPTKQSNPNNIKFYKNRESHLNQGHGGNFHNESDMPMIDRPKMVKNTRNKSIVKNELRGVGIAAIIGFGTTATMSYIIELSKNGVSYETFKEATTTATINGMVGAGLGVGTYLIHRGIGLATDYAVKKFGVQLSEQALKGVKGGVAGGLLIASTSVYEYWKLRKGGYCIQDSLIETGKQSAIPTVTLALSLYGGPVGKTIGIVTTLGYMVYSVYYEFMNQKLADELVKLQLELLYDKISRRCL